MQNLRPSSARCDNGRLFVTVSDGREISVPLWWYPRLISAEKIQLNDIRILPMGLHWPDIDEDISLDSILRGEKAQGAIDPAKANLDLNALFASIRPLPADWESREESWIEGAHQPIDYRSMIHKVVSDGRNFGESAANFDYDRFYAATDTLLDVGSLLYVAEKYQWPHDETIGELWMYGALQALAVQQDAVRQLLECFKLSIHTDAKPIFDEVRDLRIAAVGHPQDHQNRNLNYKGCTFLSHREHGPRTKFNIATLENFTSFIPRTIDVPKLVSKQQCAVQMSLAKAWGYVKADVRFQGP